MKTITVTDISTFTNSKKGILRFEVQKDDDCALDNLTINDVVSLESTCYAENHKTAKVTKITGCNISAWIELTTICEGNHEEPACELEE